MRAQPFAREHYLYLNQTSRGNQDDFIINKVREMRSKRSCYTATLWIMRITHEMHASDFESDWRYLSTPLTRLQ